MTEQVIASEAQFIRTSKHRMCTVDSAGFPQTMGLAPYFTCHQKNKMATCASKSQNCNLTFMLSWWTFLLRYCRWDDSAGSWDTLFRGNQENSPNKRKEATLLNATPKISSPPPLSRCSSKRAHCLNRSGRTWWTIISSSHVWALSTAQHANDKERKANKAPKLTRIHR